MNEKSKAWLQKLNSSLVHELSAAFSVNVYQDQVSEDEEDDVHIHYFIFETGAMTKQNERSLSQDVLIRYYSENRDDLDERTIDIISVLENTNHTFANTNKTAIQKGETDSYVDEIEFYLTRKIKYGC